MITTHSIERLQQLWHRNPRRHKHLCLYIIRRASPQQLRQWWDRHCAYHAIHVLLRSCCHAAFVAALVARCPRVLLLRDAHGFSALAYKELYNEDHDDALWCFCVAVLFREMGNHQALRDALRYTSSDKEIPMTAVQREFLQQFCEGQVHQLPKPSTKETAFWLDAWRGNAAAFITRSSLQETPTMKYSPLWFAAVSNHPDIVNVLLRKSTTTKGLGALFPLVCSLGHHDVIAVFLRSGAVTPSTLRKELDGFRCLHWCILHGNLAIVDLLLAHGAEVTNPHDGLSPLDLAVSLGHRVIVQHLLREGALSENTRMEDEGPLRYCLQAHSIHHCGIFHDIRRYYKDPSLFVQPENAFSPSLLDHAAASNCNGCLEWCLRAAPTLAPVVQRGLVVPTIYCYAMWYADEKQLQVLDKELRGLHVRETSKHVAAYTLTYHVIKRNELYRESLLLYLLRTRPHEFNSNTLSEFLEGLLTNNREAMVPVPWLFLETLLHHDCIKEWCSYPQHRYVCSRSLNFLLLEFARQRTACPSPDACAETPKHESLAFQVLLLYYRRVVAGSRMHVFWDGLHRLGVFSAFTPKELEDLAWVLYHECGVRTESVLTHVYVYRRKLHLLETIKTRGIPQRKESGNTKSTLCLRGLSTIPWLTWKQDMRPLLGMLPFEDNSA